MHIPPYVADTLTCLESAGFEAYVVGGCVRDSLLGLTPHDFDICTSALPEQVSEVFSTKTVIHTGILHGTVTVLIDSHPLEITTYRIEADYRDHRHPDTVQFVQHIEQDLSRRDFTVNAMAYHPVRGLVDPFGGAADAERQLLRAVGDPQKRFEEDALRVLRAMRFASVYGFDIEEKTKNGLLACAPLLTEIAAERVWEELKRMLTGEHIGAVLSTLYPVLFPILPELKAAQGIDQHSRYHHLDVLMHILTAVEHAEPDLTVRLAALLHDIGKPYCFSLDEKGNGHFYGHAEIGERMAREVLERLRFDRKTTEEVCLLIRYHDMPIERTDKAVRRWMNRLGVPRLRRLLALKRADAMAHAAELMDGRFAELADVNERIDRLLAERACFSLRDLAVNGRDLLTLGIPQGKAIGECLQWLLDEVMEQRLVNDEAALTQAVRKRLDYFAKKR